MTTKLDLETDCGVEFVIAGPVGRLTLSRPERLNALTARSARAILDALTFAESQAHVRVVVLSGAGRAFCSGADLTETDEPVMAADMNVVVRKMLQSPLPIVGVVNGPAAGVGASLALACDYLLMASNASLVLAFARVGLMPDGGLSALLPASVGRSRALRLAMRGGSITAHEALECGIAAEVLKACDLDGRAAEVVSEFATGPTLAYGRTKQVLNFAALGTIHEVMECEATRQDELIATPDHQEGVAAFQERRAAEFSGVAAHATNPSTEVEYE